MDVVDGGHTLEPVRQAFEFNECLLNPLYGSTGRQCSQTGRAHIFMIMAPHKSGLGYIQICLNSACDEPFGPELTADGLSRVEFGIRNSDFGFYWFQLTQVQDDALSV